jgi:hypothetical protein
MAPHQQGEETMSVNKQQLRDREKDRKGSRKAPIEADPLTQATTKRRLAKGALLIGGGVVTGIGEWIGFHVSDFYDPVVAVGGAVFANSWSWPALGGCAIIATGATQKGRAVICNLLRWVLSKLEGGTSFTMVVLVLTAISLTACADHLGANFQLVKVGETEAGTIAIMGRAPSSRSVTHVPGGIVIETLRWKTAAPERTFVIVLVGVRKWDADARVIGSRSCEGIKTC